MSLQDEFWECPFLADAANELKKHSQLRVKNEKYLLKRYELAHQRVIELLDAAKSDRRQGECLTLARKLKRERDILDTKVNKGEEQTISLHGEIKILYSQVTDKQNELPELAEQAEYLKEQVATVEQDVTNEKKQHQLQYKSLLLTKDAYKRYLGCHVRLLKSDENGNQYIFTFDSHGHPQSQTSESMPLKSIKLLQTPKEKNWKLLETNPPLPNIEQLSRKLSESDDIQGLLFYLSTVFKTKKRRVDS